jgi:hypothetical protein
MRFYALNNILTAQLLGINHHHVASVRMIGRLGCQSTLDGLLKVLI